MYFSPHMSNSICDGDEEEWKERSGVDGSVLEVGNRRGSLKPFVLRSHRHYANL
ncbi:unnamed protein product [Arabidopsis arenosa]|uniref:Uncharacterized protein n=1 Tax=Arabidopsis arenosa TaxID=38785 RepID=A0A8S1ZL99_ARAAE|nr:unnamed protein product [Arabidopsis arenosa]